MDLLRKKIKRVSTEHLIVSGTDVDNTWMTHGPWSVFRIDTVEPRRRVVRYFLLDNTRDRFLGLQFLISDRVPVCREFPTRPYVCVRRTGTPRDTTGTNRPLTEAKKVFYSYSKDTLVSNLRISGLSISEGGERVRGGTRGGKNSIMVEITLH